MNNSESAASRVDYQVTTKRASIPRRFLYGELTGENIDCAYNKGEYSRGGWTEFPEKDLSETEWIEHFFMMALQEAVHEVCEWYKLDGADYLDPHIIGNKIDIRDAVMRLWEELKQIKRRNHTVDRGPIVSVE